MHNDRANLISILIPAYNEEYNIAPMHSALVQMAESVSEFEFEFIFIDDGSSDNTFALLQDLNARDPRIKIVRLSRNFGSHIGVSVGLDFASGAAAIVLHCDLQTHPMIIPDFIAKWREGHEVVWGVRASREDGYVTELFSSLFARVMRFIALPNYIEGTGSICLLDRKIVDDLLRFPEHNRMISGLIQFCGYSQAQIPAHRQKRQHGKSSYSFFRKFKLLIDSVVSFSSTPIRLASLLGSILAVISFILGFYLIVQYFLFSVPVPGWTSILVGILFIGGVQLLVLGLLGEYLWRTLEEARRRPLYLVWKTVGFGDTPKPTSESRAKN